MLDTKTFSNPLEELRAGQINNLVRYAMERVPISNSFIGIKFEESSGFVYPSPCHRSYWQSLSVTSFQAFNLNISNYKSGVENTGIWFYTDYSSTVKFESRKFDGRYFRSYDSTGISMNDFLSPMIKLDNACRLLICDTPWELSYTTQELGNLILAQIKELILLFEKSEHHQIDEVVKSEDELFHTGINKVVQNILFGSNPILNMIIPELFD